MSLLSADSINRISAELASATPGVRYRGLATLSKYGTPADTWAIDPLVGLLRGVLAPPDRELYRQAEETAVTIVRVLGFVGDTRAVEPLIDALAHWDARLSSAAGWALGEIGDPRAITPLMNVFRTRRDYGIAWALGALRATDAAGMLLATLEDQLRAQDDDPDAIELLTALINALGKLGDRRARVALLPLLAAPDAALRLEAMIALSRLGDDYDLAVILDASTSESRVARLSVAERLSEQGDPLGVATAIDVYQHYNTERRIDFVISLSRYRPPRPPWVVQTLTWIQQHDSTPTTLGWTLAEGAARALKHSE